MHDARAVANYFIQRSLHIDVSLTPLQIIKLSYLACAWWLAYNEEPLIEQNIEAWTYGPVISDIYHELKGYGSSPVKRLIPSFSPVFSEEETNILSQVFNIYKTWDGGQLSALTHEAGTPWSTVYTTQNTNIIPNKLIQTFYRNKLNAA